MYWIGLVIVGLLAGAIAKFLLPGKDPGGCVVTLLIGLAGSLLGGFLFATLGNPTEDRVSWEGLAVAVVGSIVLLLLYRLIARRR
ncbi:MAG TPA: GlsB/YeaQ/YmgE family stress response membrane protein [Gemmatimonadota bacterium]|jgi:uncharacterized membrane protein YeaQ/YmgE (transglycosylase-associated protein family)